MKRPVWIVILLLIALGGQWGSLVQVTEARREAARAQGPELLLPVPVLRLAALEFQPLAADLLFIRAITFYGERTGKRLPIAPAEWDQLGRFLDAVTELDPYFLDPYLFGEMVLVWDAGRIDEANRLLEKGMRYRTWDWRVPFYLGFNHFYFLQDYERGAEYLMAASRRPGSFGFVPLLAARLSQQAGRTEAAVIFLEELYRQAADPSLRENIRRRLQAMQAILVLERAVSIFQDRFGEVPRQVQSLVEAGILKRLPEDPYGGEFVIRPDGRVETTSRMVLPRPSPAGDG